MAIGMQLFETHTWRSTRCTASTKTKMHALLVWNPLFFFQGGHFSLRLFKRRITANDSSGFVCMASCIRKLTDKLYWLGIVRMVLGWSTEFSIKRGNRFIEDTWFPPWWLSQILGHNYERKKKTLLFFDCYMFVGLPNCFMHTSLISQLEPSKL